jgi:hypothetical protein
VTAWEWIKRGEGRHSARGANGAYTAFAQAIRKAQAEDEATRIQRIRDAGHGGTVIHEKTTTYKDGRVVQEVERSAPDWRSDAWWLERTMPERYALKAHVDVNILVQRMAERLAVEHGVEAAAIIEEAHRLIADRP